MHGMDELLAQSGAPLQELADASGQDLPDLLADVLTEAVADETEAWERRWASLVPRRRRRPRPWVSGDRTWGAS